MSEGNVIPLHERDTERPPPGETPPICQGLERTALEFGYVGEQLDWTTKALQLIAAHLGVDLPPLPLRR